MLIVPSASVYASDEMKYTVTIEPWVKYSSESGAFANTSGYDLSLASRWVAENWGVEVGAKYFHFYFSTPPQYSELSVGSAFVGGFASTMFPLPNGKEFPVFLHLRVFHPVVHPAVGREKDVGVTREVEERSVSYSLEAGACVRKVCGGLFGERWNLSVLSISKRPVSLSIYGARLHLLF